MTPPPPGPVISDVTARLAQAETERAQLSGEPQRRDAPDAVPNP
jgi:hypothetical protein